MSTFDVVTTLQSDLPVWWKRARPDVLTHMVAAGAVFLVAGVSLPMYDAAAVDAMAITSTSQYRLAKELELLWLTPALAVILVAAYVLLLHSIGSVLAGIFLLALPLPHRIPSTMPALLFNVAATIPADQLNDFSLTRAFDDLRLRYQFKFKDQWVSLMQASYELAGDARTMLGNYATFAVVGAVLFANGRFEDPAVPSALLLLLILTLWSLWRAHIAVRMVSLSEWLAVGTLIQIDPEYQAMLAAAQSRDGEIHKAVKEITRAPATAFQIAPKVARLSLGYRSSVLYKRGQGIAWALERNPPQRPQTPSDFYAFTYYRLAEYVATRIRYLGHTIKIWVTGRH